LLSCLRHPAFAAGEATTAFIGQYRNELLAPRKDAASDAELAALLLYVTDPFAPKWHSGRSLAATFPVPVRFELDHRVHDIEITRERDGSYRGLANTPYRIEIHAVEGHTIRVDRDGVSESVTFLRDGDRLWFLHRGSTLAVRDLTLAAPVSAAAAAATARCAPR
jgi:Acetyl/propionyl-CoA carboxylase, alpha subunit